MTLHAEFINITKDLNEYKKRIDIFLNTLDSEKSYFHLTTERVIKAEMIIIVLVEGQIIGVGGLERKLGLSRSIMMLKKNFQGKGIGKRLNKRILEKAKYRYSIILGVIEENNIPSIRMHLSVGYKMVGKRRRLCYLFCPLNIKGLIMCYGIKLLFPLINIIDLIRR